MHKRLSIISNGGSAMPAATKHIFQPFLYPYTDAFSDLVSVQEAQLIEAFLERRDPVEEGSAVAGDRRRPVAGMPERRIQVGRSREDIEDSIAAVGAFLGEAGMEPCEASCAIYDVGKHKQSKPGMRLRLCWNGKRIFSTLMVASAPLTV